MTNDKGNNWFEVWFDSPYYHMLYGNRDYTEADAFVQLLAKNLHLPAGSKVLDLACGKGRHAISLNKLGFDVLGVDLAAESIRQASAFENESLHFAVHDMRNVWENRIFDCVFNLFTSFGYFDSDAENLKVLQAVKAMLRPGGLLVIDFMNADKVVRQLVEHESKSCSGFEFEIKRKFDGKHIYKEIRLSDQGRQFQFQERVQAINRDQFSRLLEQAGFELKQIWGSYQLEKFEVETSDRLILVAAKI